MSEYDEFLAFFEKHGVPFAESDWRGDWEEVGPTPARCIAIHSGMLLLFFKDGSFMGSYDQECGSFYAEEEAE